LQEELASWFAQLIEPTFPASAAPLNELLPAAAFGRSTSVTVTYFFIWISVMGA
jgi:hypothetical protein